MRTLAVLLLFAALGGAGLWLLRAEGLAPSSLLQAQAGGETRDALRAAPEQGAAPGPDRAEGAAQAQGARLQAADDGARVYYQYVDEAGAVRFVDRLEDVPAAQRASAGRIEVEARPTPAAAPAGRRSGPRPFARAAAEPSVVVYTTSWCGWCRKTLAWLDRRGVTYVNKDIEADPDHRNELLRKAGRASIPVVEIDGTLVRGYDPSRMEALLGS